MAGLRILQSFGKDILKENFSQYRPGYHTSQSKSQNILTIRLRIEYDGYESRQLLSLLGKSSKTSGKDNQIDYIMLRMPKLYDMLEDVADEENEAFFEQNIGRQDQPVPSGQELLKQGSQSITSTGPSMLSVSTINTVNKRQASTRQVHRASTKLRMSAKVNHRSTEQRLNLRNLQLLKRQSSSFIKEGPEEEKKGMDLEENKQRQQLMSQILQDRRAD